MKKHSMLLRSVGVPARPGMRKPARLPVFISSKRIKKTDYLPVLDRKMKAENISRTAIETFRHYYRKVREGADGLIDEAEIKPIKPADIVREDQLSEFADTGRKALHKTAMIVLNGGLGTGMGLDFPKSLVPVKGGRSFLEITLNQALHQGARLCFMNSFSTHNATRGFLAACNFSYPAAHFIQNKFPKILRDNLAPARWPKDPSLEWNPAGHGDIYNALHASGTLDRMLDADIRYAFVSNSDNLGGTPDESLLGYFVESGIPFMLEVSRRSPADIKGGHIARNKNGCLMLREISQCPPKDLMNFQDIFHHYFFNTNNIWIDLEALNKRIKNHGPVRLPIILNPKTLDPKDAATPPVYQIETAMGSAVALFDGASAVAVKRNRFFPVKTCNDLLVVRSDRVLLSRDSRLVPNPENRSETIHVRLDPKFYGKLDMFEQRFPFGPPSLTDCSSLTVEGDVRFERNVVLKGNVSIRNKSRTQEIIKAGTVITGDLLSKPHTLSGPQLLIPATNCPCVACHC